VSGFTDFAGCEVMNGFGGLDRCNDGNILSSPTVTVDDTNANHVYAAWANNTAANNENTLVADSTDGGVNWRAAVTINTNVTTRRFMPWACASGGSAFVTWSFPTTTSSRSQRPRTRSATCGRPRPVPLGTRRTARFSPRMQADAAYPQIYAAILVATGLSARWGKPAKLEVAPRSMVTTTATLACSDVFTQCSHRASV
jgi:hypothetical protein